MDDNVQNPYRQASVSLFKTAGWLHAHLDENLQPLGISAQQLKVLSVIHQQPGHRATVNTIRENMMDPGSNVSRLINKLMEKQLVEKRRSREDQRVVHIHLTEKGRDIMCTGREALAAGENVICKLSSAEISQLTALLDKLRG